MKSFIHEGLFYPSDCQFHVEKRKKRTISIVRDQNRIMMTILAEKKDEHFDGRMKSKYEPEKNENEFMHKMQNTVEIRRKKTCSTFPPKKNCKKNHERSRKTRKRSAKNDLELSIALKQHRKCNIYIYICRKKKSRCFPSIGQYFFWHGFPFLKKKRAVSANVLTHNWKEDKKKVI